MMPILLPGSHAFFLLVYRSGEGFPRGDVDVARVSVLRHEVTCWRNDLKGIMKNIEQGLHALHALAASSSGTGASSGMPGSSSRGGGAAESKVAVGGEVRRLAPSVDADVGRPNFAWVEGVSRDGPADVAGIMKGDMVVRFGSAHAGNSSSIAPIGDVVRQSMVRQPFLWPSLCLSCPLPSLSPHLLLRDSPLRW
jgi:26S proteasome regulatory subunit N4